MDSIVYYFVLFFINKDGAVIHVLSSNTTIALTLDVRGHTDYIMLQ